MSTKQATVKRRGARALLAIAGIAASLAVLAPAAGAADVTATKAATSAATVTPMDESGMSGGIRVTAVGSGSYVSRVNVTVSSLSPYLSFYGYYRIFGPDYSVTSATQSWGTGNGWGVTVGRHYANGQLHCAEGWRRNSDGSFTLLGRPCVDNPI